jgi:hypothetical protein
MNLVKKELMAFCVVLLAIICLSGCGGKYALVAGREDMTEADYLKAKEECIQITNGAGYSNRFRYVPGVAPKDAPRTNVSSRYAECMESKEFVCLNCKRSFQAQPKQFQSRQVQPKQIQPKEALEPKEPQ